MRSPDSLTVILFGFNNGHAGRMALFAHARRLRALSWCGELPGVRASAAAAVCLCTKASGRRMVRWEFPRACRVRCLRRASSPAAFACAVTRR